MSSNQAITYLPIALIATICGVYMLIKRDVSIGFGRGRPVVKTQVNKGSLINILGFSFIFGGVICGIPFILSILNIHFDYVGWLPIFGILIPIAGVIFTMIFQFAILLGEWVGEKRGTLKPDDK